jgi:leucine-zipper of insertion element IS481
MYEEQNEPINAISTKKESSSTATRSGDTARALIRRAKQASRRRFPSEERICILLEEVRAEVFGGRALPSRGDLSRRGELVRRSPVEKKQTLGELGLPASTHYRWQRRDREQGEAGLLDRRRQPGTVWNRMKPEEEKAVLGAALREPGLGVEDGHDSGVHQRRGGAGGGVDGDEERVGRRSLAAGPFLLSKVLKTNRYCG